MIVESISRFARSTHDLLEKVQMVLRGEMEHYLSLGCGHSRLED